MNNNFLQTWFQRMLQSTQKKTKGTVLKKREEKKNTKKQCLIESFVHPTLLTDRRVLANPSKRTATACHHFSRQREREREREKGLFAISAFDSQSTSWLSLHSFLHFPSVTRTFFFLFLWPRSVCFFSDKNTTKKAENKTWCITHPTETRRRSLIIHSSCGSAG